MRSFTESSVQEIIERARAVVFDFDGTLVDSNAIKWRAFDRCFEEHADRRLEIQAYCRGQHHTPRWEKFRHIYEQILKQPYTPQIEARLLEMFDEETREQIVAAQEIPGASAFVRAVAASRPVSVLSSTPHATLLTILNRRGWRRWCTHIQGAPVQKAQWLAQLKHHQGFSEQEVVFFGDTPDDAQAARDAGCVFVGVGAQLERLAEHWLLDFIGVGVS